MPYMELLDLRMVADMRPYKGWFMNSQFKRVEIPGVREEVRLFTRRFIKAAEDLNIPLFASEMLADRGVVGKAYVQGHADLHPSECPHVAGRAVRILHCHYMRNMGPKHWQALILLGQDVAARQSLKIVNAFADHGGDPAQWLVRKNVRVSKKSLAESGGLVLSPITGEAQTLSERIAEAEAYGKELCKRTSEHYGNPYEQAKGPDKGTP